MQTSNVKPQLFIGSSSQSLEAARALKSLLEGVAEVHVWESAFPLGNTTISSLERQLNRSDYAVLITTPDDLIASGDNHTVAPRDNVIFEAGLFMGRLGRHRAFVVCDRRRGPIAFTLPSDWQGLTVAEYDSSAGQLGDALLPAATQIAQAVNSGGLAMETDFLRSYLTFIPPDTRIWENYGEILSRHYDQLTNEIDRLRSEHDWARLLEVKARLREYFEYSGKYRAGVGFGEAFVEALTAIGRYREAAWSRVKDIGYMMIMADRHGEGRRVIKEVLDSLPNTGDADTHKLLFYANRYIGISYERDNSTGDMRKAAEFLERAQRQLGAFREGTRDYKQLDARIRRNFGNLSLANGLRDDALELFRQSLQIFEELEDDIEHIEYSHLALAKGMIVAARPIAEAPEHLGRALSLFSKLGCIEGLGRVHEQYARYYLLLARGTWSRKKRKAFLAEAENHANSARHLFQRIGVERLCGRVDELLGQIDEAQKL